MRIFIFAVKMNLFLIKHVYWIIKYKCNDDMNTLNINAELLQQAEMKAQMHNLNLNEFVEAFIRKFIKNPHGEEQTVIKTTPFVERLGVDLDLPADFDEKVAYRNYLSEKNLQ